MNKTSKIIVGVVSFLIIVAAVIVVILSAVGVLPNWFGLYKQSSETDKLVGAYSISVDMKLLQTEYQKIINDPVKQTTFINDIRSNMATKLGFDEQTAEDRVVVTLSKNEQFRQKETYQTSNQNINTDVLILPNSNTLNPTKELEQLVDDKKPAKEISTIIEKSANTIDLNVEQIEKPKTKSQLTQSDVDTIINEPDSVLIISDLKINLKLKNILVDEAVKDKMIKENDVIKKIKIAQDAALTAEKNEQIAYVAIEEHAMAKNKSKRSQGKI